MMVLRVRKVMRVLRTVASSQIKRFGTAIALVVLCLLLNAVCFSTFENASDAAHDYTFWDGLYFSVVSITTIGYGDYSPTSLGARLSWVVFIVFIGLGTFTYLVGLGVDFFVELKMREVRGMNPITGSGHIIIVNFPSEARVRRMIQELRRDAPSRDAEIVIVADSLEELPFREEGVRFVRGSLLAESTFERAGLDQARHVLVLATGLDDPRSDGIAASIISVVKHAQPGAVVIGECLDPAHVKLFQNNGCDRVVPTDRIAANVLIHESQDAGVGEVLADLTCKLDGCSFYSAEMEHTSAPFNAVARALFDMPNRIIPVAIVRDGKVFANPTGDEQVTPGVRLIYISNRREDWPTIERELKSRL